MYDVNATPREQVKNLIETVATMAHEAEQLHARIQELEAERDAYRAACDGMTPDGLHAWIKEVTADYAKLRPHSIRRASSGKIVDGVLEKVAMLEAQNAGLQSVSDKLLGAETLYALAKSENGRLRQTLRGYEAKNAMLEEQNTNLLTYIGSEPTTADDVNTGTVATEPVAVCVNCDAFVANEGDYCENCKLNTTPRGDAGTEPEPCSYCKGTGTIVEGVHPGYTWTEPCPVCRPYPEHDEADELNATPRVNGDGGS